MITHTKKAPNYFLHVLRMTGVCSASSKHCDSTWKRDVRFRGRKSVEVKIPGRQLVLQKDLKMNRFLIGTCTRAGAGRGGSVCINGHFPFSI